MFRWRRAVPSPLALKTGGALFLLSFLFLYSNQSSPTTDPELQKLAAQRYSEEEEKILDGSSKDKGELNDLKEKKAHVNSVSPEVKTCDTCHKQTETNIHVAVVACGDRMPETIILLKSAVMFSLPSSYLHFHIFTEFDLQPLFSQALDAWPSFVRARFNYTLYPIKFPETENFETWKSLFKPCACQRLFIPGMLPDMNLLLYVDTDILFLTPLHLIWGHFAHFNQSQLAALAPEHEDKHMGWYNRFAMHPYYGELGLNSGVMLMHLDRMRETGWEKKMIEYQVEWNKKIVWGDQDLINIYFSYYPEKLYPYQCHWNYRPDHCMYMQTCPSAVKNGVSVLHGNRRAFHNDKQLSFKVIYEALAAYSWDSSDPYHDLVKTIEDRMKSIKDQCGKQSEAILKSLRASIVNIPRKV